MNSKAELLRIVGVLNAAEVDSRWEPVVPRIRPTSPPWNRSFRRH